MYGMPYVLNAVLYEDFRSTIQSIVCSNVSMDDTAVRVGGVLLLLLLSQPVDLLSKAVAYSDDITEQVLRSSTK